jgi:dTDP-4-amino-4,6-dideoxygalactose transaminase
MRSTFLPFSTPTIEDAEINEVVDSLKSGWITTGPKVKRFEEDFKAYVGVPYAIPLSSATAGLHLTLLALGRDHHHPHDLCLHGQHDHPLRRLAGTCGYRAGDAQYRCCQNP